MNARFEARLHAISLAGDEATLLGGRLGIEKESLRVTPAGYIATTPHPRALGSALTNRFITTDYSEALLEFVTPPLASSWEGIQFLCDIHQFAYAAIDDELLWPLSMPCMIRSEDDIPLAQYGSSNIGAMKTIYRRGLGFRYGRYMQAISGIHFNYSLADAFWPLYKEVERSDTELHEFRSNSYLGLVRNVRRFDWLLLYLFGASPAVCKSFLSGVETDLEELDEGTLYGRYATSLRMSELGYQNTNQAELIISANSLDEYVQNLNEAVHRPSPEYQKIGIKVGGQYRQLSANQLQIENEYYSTIRPKRVAKSGEHATEALRRGGVEYVELRALDVNPFDPVGINQKQVKFLEAFLIFCLLNDSEPIDQQEQKEINRNRVAVAHQGRKPDLKLIRRGVPVSLHDWGNEICEQMMALGEILDALKKQSYTEVIDSHHRMIENPELTTAAQLVSEIRETREPMFTYAMNLSRTYREYFHALAPEFNTNWKMLEAESRDSIKRQVAVEASDAIEFDEYLERYLS